MSTAVVYGAAEGHEVRVTGLAFAVASPRATRAQSVVRVVEPTLYEKGVPKDGGLLDRRMGIVERRFRCGTCGHGETARCPGHMGHIELAEPIYHVSFLPDVLKLLQLVCFWCSRLLVDPTKAKVRQIVAAYSGAERFARLCKDRPKGRTVQHCAHCGGAQPQYKKRKGNVCITTAWDVEQLDDEAERKTAAKDFTAAAARAIVAHIPAADLILLGFEPARSHPRNFMLTVLPVPPPMVRPAAGEGDGLRSHGQDDLTLKLQEIVKADAEVRAILADGGDPAELAARVDILQNAHAAYVSNDGKKSKQRSGAPTKSIFSRIDGKEARMRGNLMGKRADFSGRAVISPDAMLNVDELGVPEHICMTLTYPERVQPYNFADLQRRVRNGPSVLHGAKTVIDMSNPAEPCTINLDACRHEDIELQMGWIVERHLRNGDLVIFNRQPSLQKTSMMCHKLRVMPGPTFRLNLSAVTPYNADFDGDEMSLHVPQSELARGEMQEIMALPRQIVTAQSNKPCMGTVQDALLGTYEMTRMDVFFTREEAMDLAMQLHHTEVRELPIPTILKPRPLWTGKQIYSLLLRDCVTLSKNVRELMPPKPATHPPPAPQATEHKAATPAASSDCKEGAALQVSQERAVGAEVASAECKTTAADDMAQGAARCTEQDGRKADVHEHARASREWCAEEDTMERCVVLVRGELLLGALCKQVVGSVHGGIVHVLYRDAGPQAAANFLSDAQHLVNHWLARRGFSVGMDDFTTSARTKREVRAAIDHAERVVRAVTRVAARSDGTLGSVASVPARDVERYVLQVANKVMEESGCIVQETTTDNSIHEMVAAGSKGSRLNEAQMRGVVGQQNAEGQRIYAQNGSRTLSCFRHGDASLAAHGFVRNSYETGLTASEFFFHAIGGREGLVDTGCKTADTGYLQRKLVKQMENHTVDARLAVRSDGQVLETLAGGDGADATFLERLDLPELSASDADLAVALSEPDSRTCTPVEAGAARDELRLLREARDRLRRHRQGCARPNDALFVSIPVPRMLAQTLQRQAETHTVESRVTRVQLLALHAAFELAVTRASAHSEFAALRFALRCVLTHKRAGTLTHTSAKDLFARMEREFMRALAQPGEMVGAVSACAIGEPSTQMTLNTFHFAGIAAKNVTLGIPRLKEIVHASRCMRKQVISVALRAPFSVSKAGAQLVQRSLEGLTLAQLSRGSELVRLPPDAVASFKAQQTTPPAPRIWSAADSGAGAWSVRYTLDRDALAHRGLAPRDVELLLQARLDGLVVVRASDYTAKTWTLDVTPLYARDIAAALAQQGLARPPVAQNQKFEPCAPSAATGSPVRNKLVSGGTAKRKRVASPARRPSPKRARAATELDEAKIAAPPPRLDVEADAEPEAAEVPAEAKAAEPAAPRATEGKGASELLDAERALAVSLRGAMLDLRLGGVEGVMCATPVEVSRASVDRATGAVVTRKSWGLDVEVRTREKTSAMVLPTVMRVAGVDAERTQTNDLWETYSLLGVDAAAAVIFQELKAVVSFDGTYINDRHLMLTAATMTRFGALTPYSYPGVVRSDDGVMRKASFERIGQVLMSSAEFGRTDGMRGVTGNICFGQLAPIGSALTDMLPAPCAPARTVRERSQPAALSPPALPASSTSATAVPNTARSAAPSIEDALDALLDAQSRGAGLAMRVADNSWLTGGKTAAERDCEACAYRPSSPLLADAAISVDFLPLDHGVSPGAAPSIEDSNRAADLGAVPLDFDLLARALADAPTSA